MKYIIIFIILVFSINSSYSDVLDSLQINDRLEKAIELIKNDSLFISYENLFGKVISFKVEDSLLCQLMTYNYLKRLFPYSNTDYIIKKYKEYKNCFEFFKNKIIKLMSQYLSNGSNYLMTIGILDSSLIFTLIHPFNNSDADDKFNQCFFVYNYENMIIRYFTKIYFVSN